MQQVDIKIKENLESNDCVINYDNNKIPDGITVTKSLSLFLHVEWNQLLFCINFYFLGAWLSKFH